MSAHLNNLEAISLLFVPPLPQVSSFESLGRSSQHRARPRLLFNVTISLRGKVLYLTLPRSALRPRHKTFIRSPLLSANQLARSAANAPLRSEDVLSRPMPHRRYFYSFVDDAREDVRTGCDTSEYRCRMLDRSEGCFLRMKELVASPKTINILRYGSRQTAHGCTWVWILHELGRSRSVPSLTSESYDLFLLHPHMLLQRSSGEKEHRLIVTVLIQRHRKWY